MNIAIVTPYGETYSNDQLFDIQSCKIGQNLLLPGIKLKEELNRLGHEYHTIDMYSSIDEVDVWLFQDIGNTSILTAETVKDWAKYIIKKRWKTDYLYIISKLNKKRKILIMQEPQTVFPQSYNKNNHKFFDYILTWDQNLVDNIKYHQFLYPQVKPADLYCYPYKKKRFMTMICGNKSSKDSNELYSERLKVIEYYEQKNYQFDLYGFGWSNSERTSYRGVIEDKLCTLSKYKFSVCFENMKSKGAYITEKIFDCFFAGCIPIYYGSEAVLDYIPKNTFVDYRDFKDLNEINDYLVRMSQEEYSKMLMNAAAFLESDLYKVNFSIESYVDRMLKAITAGPYNDKQQNIN